MVSVKNISDIFFETKSAILSVIKSCYRPRRDRYQFIHVFPYNAARKILLKDTDP